MTSHYWRVFNGSVFGLDEKSMASRSGTMKGAKLDDLDRQEL